MDKASGVKNVRTEIAIIAGSFDGNRKSWLARVSRKVPTVTYRTVRSLWYGEIDDPEHWAARDIRRAAEIIEARRETSALADQYQTIIGGLRAADENFYRSEINRLERIARLLGAVDRSGTEGKIK